MNEFKIVFVGSPGVGAKTSLIKRFRHEQFKVHEVSTSGASYSDINVNTVLGKIKLILWDTVGQQQYKSLLFPFLKDSNCFILGYSITNKDSFYDIKNDLFNRVLKYVKNDELIYLVGNKIDLYEDRKVSQKEAKDYAKEKSMKFFEISAKTQENVEELFEDICNSLLYKYRSTEMKIILNNENNYLKKMQKYYNY